NAGPVAELIARGTLRELPGSGKTIAGRIEEICAGGTCAYLAELEDKYPPTLMELLDVPGVGMKTATAMFEQLGVASLADLERALESGRITELPRLGKKSIENM